MTTTTSTTSTTSTSSTSTVDVTSSQWVTNLVTTAMASDEEALDALEEKRDAIELQLDAYDTIETDMKDLDSAIDDLIGYNGAVNDMSATTSTSGILTASALSVAKTGDYTITVNQLAEAYTLASSKQTANNTDLNLSGSFSLNGTTITVSTTDSLYDIRDLINNATFEDGMGVVATVVDYRLVLTSESTGSDYQIAIEDLDGGTVLDSLGFFDRSVSDVTDTVTANGVTGFSTADLIEFTDGSITGALELASGTVYVEIGTGANANKFRLVNADGEVQAIASTSGGTTSTTDWISIDSENLSYDTGRGLVITFSDDSSWTSVTRTSGAASVSVASSLIQNGQDAELTVNGLSITRSSNTTLNDIITGVTLNLTSTGSTTLTIGQDTDAVTTKVESALTAFNTLLSYIKEKTTPQVSEETSTSTTTLYTQATLGSDWSLKALRQYLSVDLLSVFSDSSNDSIKSLSDIGIDLDDDTMTFSIYDEDAFADALSEDSSAVAELLDYVFSKIQDRLSPYIDGSNSRMDVQQEALEDQISIYESRIDSKEARMKVREAALKAEYAAWQAMIIDYKNQANTYSNLLSNLQTLGLA